MIKTKEMIVDYRKNRTEHTPILIDGDLVEQVESFRFLGVHITNTLTEGTTKPIPPQETEKICHGSSDPQFYNCIIEHPYWLHHCLVWQLLDLQLQVTTEGSAYGAVHHWGQASCHPGLIYQAVSGEGPKNCQRLQPPES
jgi:hypothetical protein